MHCVNMKVTVGDLRLYTQTMVDLLEDPVQLMHHPAAIQAVADIKAVMYYWHHQNKCY